MFQDQFLPVHDRATQRHAEKNVIVLTESSDASQWKLNNQVIDGKKFVLKILRR
jgi:hypothetical protein